MLFNHAHIHTHIHMYVCLGFYWTEEVLFAESIYFRTHNKFSVFVFGDCGCKYTTGQATNLNNKLYLFNFLTQKPSNSRSSSLQASTTSSFGLPLSYIYSRVFLISSQHKDMHQIGVEQTSMILAEWSLWRCHLQMQPYLEVLGQVFNFEKTQFIP